MLPANDCDSPDPAEIVAHVAAEARKDGADVGIADEVAAITVRMWDGDSANRPSFHDCVQVSLFRVVGVAATVGSSLSCA